MENPDMLQIVEEITPFMYSRSFLNAIEFYCIREGTAKFTNFAKDIYHINDLNKNISSALVASYLKRFSDLKLINHNKQEKNEVQYHFSDLGLELIKLLRSGKILKNQKNTFRNYPSLERFQKVINVERILENEEMEILKKEERFKIYLEENTCIVCKGKVSGMTFICKHCGTLYHPDCANSLKKNNDLCWSCRQPLDGV